ncbi:MAG: Response regulator of the LytR/AlgR family [Rhodobacteraceae bacterium HLUCCA12]|nr:MAG: Response regulator of the LytR/AlgR family [Rhodobacteraceae bacterium HLUCCA12]
MRERIVPWFPDLALRLGPPLGVGAVLGLIGPFGTFDLLSAGPRLAYWLAVVSANWLLADAVLRRVDALTHGRLAMPRLFVPLAGALVAAVPATGIVAIANGVSGIGWPGNVPVLFGQVLLLLAAIALPVYAWEEMRDAAASPPDHGPGDAGATVPAGADAGRPGGGPGDPGQSLFAARLSVPLERPLLCLEMQDHYLVVHHGGKATMILCRMDDAARELDGLGHRVHRSWWVAAGVVAGVVREGQRVSLELTDGRRVPVGRSYRPALKDAGWL